MQHKSDICSDFKSTPKRLSYFSHDLKIYFPRLAANVSFTFRSPDTFRLVRRVIIYIYIYIYIYIWRHSLRRDFGHTRVVNYVPSDSAIEIKRWKGGGRARGRAMGLEREIAARTRCKNVKTRRWTKVGGIAAAEKKSVSHREKEKSTIKISAIQSLAGNSRPWHLYY